MENKKQTLEEFMATHPENEWPRFLVAARDIAKRTGKSVEEVLQRDTDAAKSLKNVEDN